MWRIGLGEGALDRRAQHRRSPVGRDRDGDERRGCSARLIRCSAAVHVGPSFPQSPCSSGAAPTHHPAKRLRAPSALSFAYTPTGGPRRYVEARRSSGQQSRSAPRQSRHSPARGRRRPRSLDVASTSAKDQEHGRSDGAEADVRTLHRMTRPPVSPGKGAQGSSCRRQGGRGVVPRPSRAPVVTGTTGTPSRLRTAPASSASVAGRSGGAAATPSFGVGVVAPLVRLRARVGTGTSR